MTAPIAVRNLTKRFGELLAVEDVSFEVPWGRVTGFLGPNGAGKTTTLRMMLGLAEPTSGTALVLDRRYADLEDPARVVGGLLETDQFHPHRSARNHLLIYASAAGLAKTRVDEVLEMVDLTGASSKKVGAFSLGMRQRLGLATALLGDPRILVLDEPANGLDPGGMRWLRSLVRSFAAEGRIVFLSSHLLGEIAQIADDVIVLDRGRLIAHAPVDELIHGAGREVRVRTDSPERLRVALEGPGITVRSTSHDQIVVKGASMEDVGRAAAVAGVAIFGLASDDADLEDVFFQMTSKGDLR